MTRYWNLQTLAILAALAIALYAVLATTNERAPLGSFASPSPSKSSSHTGAAKSWPRCDFDGNPSNDQPGACPPWHGRK